MRVVLFYADIDSFNFAADQLEEELRKRGHEVFILDLRNPPAGTPHSYACFAQFLVRRVDMVVCFDGTGIREDLFIDIWDENQAIVIDILLDPPFRFHPSMVKHPGNYFLFCCDMEHVEYVKKYFGKEVPFVAFMPHVGVMPEEGVPVVPYADRKYDLLFTGTYYRWQDKFAQLEQLFDRNSDLYRMYRRMFDNLVRDSSLSVEKALLYTLEESGWSVSDETLKTMLRCTEHVDWAIRTYQRERVITVLAEAGFDLYLLGKGWEDYPAAQYPNVHLLDGWVTYGQTLSYTADAKISLNVMPWFKAGTHDRIFNALLQHSVPLTDSSTWIDENFTDGVDIALYNLKKLDKLPDIAHHLLTDETGAEAIIQKGYEKVVQNLTWSNCVDWILELAEKCL